MANLKNSLINLKKSLSFKLSFSLGLIVLIAVLGFAFYYVHAHERQKMVILAFILLISISTAVSLYIFFFVSRPLKQLLSKTRRIVQGDYEPEITAYTSDEVGWLAQSLGEMQEEIKSKTLQLQKTIDEFQTLFESVPCYITVQDKNFRILRTNREWAKDFGDRIGEYCYHAYKGRETKCVDCIVEKTFRDGKIHTSEEIGKKRDGTTAHFIVSTAPIKNEKDEIVAVMEMSTDVTSLRLLEDELKKSEEKYRHLFNNEPNPIFVIGQEDLQILDANQRAIQHYGYTRSELQKMTFLDIVSPGNRARIKSLSTNRSSVLDKIQHIKKDGGLIYVDIRSSPVEYLKRNALIITASDITERLQTEQQLIQAGKMATLGEMSAGVAHELNQPLSVIKTGTNFFIDKIKKAEKIEENALKTIAQEMDIQVDRATKIINHLREFGRKTDITKVEVQLNECIKGAFTMLGRQLEIRQIKVVLDLDEQLPPIMADMNQLEQVFINMIINARDAIEERVTRLGGDEQILTIRTSLRDGSVVAEVSDTGIGIPDEVKSRIFEPFFTTKEVGKGTGLGLSISYGIVRDFNGTIEVESKFGKGTTFRLAFPVETSPQ